MHHIECLPHLMMMKLSRISMKTPMMKILGYTWCLTDLLVNVKTLYVFYFVYRRENKKVHDDSELMRRHLICAFVW